MAQYHGFQFQKTLERELFYLFGHVITDGSGIPTNINDGSVTDQDGDPLYIPRGFSAVAHQGTGIYRLTLEQPWYKIIHIDATLVKSAAANSGFIVKQYNPKGSTVNSVPAQTIDLIYQVAGTATDLVSAEFYFEVVLKNDKR